MKTQLLFIIIIAITAVTFAEESELSNEATIDTTSLKFHPSKFTLSKSRQSDETEQSPEQCSEKSNQGAFTLYDYSVVIGMLVISLGIGVFYGFFDKNSSKSSADFMLGSQMGLFPVTLSLTTSFITAIELLGNPSEMYFNGTQFSLIVISMLLVIPVALKVFYPIYHEMQLTSCYEYLGMRFGKEMRIMGGVLYIIQMCFYTSVAVLAPAIALSKATGLNTRLAIVLIYVVCVFYSSQGGLKAVVIADTFQACVLFISLILILVVGTYYQTGGVSEIFKIASENDRLEFFNFDPNPKTRHTVFSVIIGGFFYWTSLLCVNQATVQKAMSLKSLTKAKIALTLSICGLVMVFLANFYTGLMTFAHYENCDPLMSGQIDASDQLVPFYIMDVFKHIKFFVGIFVAGVFAASLGTVAASLSSLSAVTIEDLLIAGVNIKITPEKGALYAKWMAVGYGIFSFGLIFLVEGRGILQATLTLNGLVGGILLGLFSLGIFFKKANVKGALYGALIALCLVIVLGVTAQIKNVEEPFLKSSISECSCIVNTTAMDHTNMFKLNDTPEDNSFFGTLYQISYIWYSMIGTLLTVFFGLLISMITEFSAKKRILKITSSHDLNAPGQFTSSTLTASGRKISSFLHHVAQDVTQSTLRVENAIKEVISHSNLHHLHLPSDSEDRISIINEETIQCGKVMKKDTATGKMFFIGLFEDNHHNKSQDDLPKPDSLHGEVNPSMNMKE